MTKQREYAIVSQRGEKTILHLQLKLIKNTHFCQKHSDYTFASCRNGNTH